MIKKIFILLIIVLSINSVQGSHFVEINNFSKDSCSLNFINNCGGWSINNYLYHTVGGSSASIQTPNNPNLKDISKIYFNNTYINNGGGFINTKLKFNGIYHSSNSTSPLELSFTSNGKFIIEFNDWDGVNPSSVNIYNYDWITNTKGSLITSQTFFENFTNVYNAYINYFLALYTIKIYTIRYEYGSYSGSLPSIQFNSNETYDPNNIPTYLFDKKIRYEINIPKITYDYYNDDFLIALDSKEFTDANWINPYWDNYYDVNDNQQYIIVTYSNYGAYAHGYSSKTTLYSTYPSLNPHNIYYYNIVDSYNYPIPTPSANPTPTPAPQETTISYTNTYATVYNLNNSYNLNDYMNISIAIDDYPKDTSYFYQVLLTSAYNNVHKILGYVYINNSNLNDATIIRNFSEEITNFYISDTYNLKIYEINKNDNDYSKELVIYNTIPISINSNNNIDIDSTININLGNKYNYNINETIPYNWDIYNYKSNSVYKLYYVENHIINYIGLLGTQTGTGNLNLSSTVYNPTEIYLYVTQNEHKIEYESNRITVIDNSKIEPNYNNTSTNSYSIITVGNGNINEHFQFDKPIPFISDIYNYHNNSEYDIYYCYDNIDTYCNLIDRNINQHYENSFTIGEKSNIKYYLLIKENEKIISFNSNYFYVNIGNNPYNPPPININPNNTYVTIDIPNINHQYYVNDDVTLNITTFNKPAGHIYDIYIVDSEGTKEKVLSNVINGTYNIQLTQNLYAVYQYNTIPNNYLFFEVIDNNIIIPYTSDKIHMTVSNYVGNTTYVIYFDKDTIKQFNSSYLHYNIKATIPNFNSYQMYISDDIGNIIMKEDITYNVNYTKLISFKTVGTFNACLQQNNITMICDFIVVKKSTQNETYYKPSKDFDNPTVAVNDLLTNNYFWGLIIVLLFAGMGASIGQGNGFIFGSVFGIIFIFLMGLIPEWVLFVGIILGILYGSINFRMGNNE